MAEHERERLDLEREKLAIDRARLEYEPKRLKYEATAKLAQVSAEATIKYSEMAIRSLLILNGGAALAVLTFAGNSSKAGGSMTLSQSVLFFGSGAALSVLTAGLSYIAQSFFSWSFSQSDPVKGWRSFCGRVAQGAAVVAALASLVVFVLGMREASGKISAGALPGAERSQPYSRETAPPPPG